MAVKNKKLSVVKKISHLVHSFPTDLSDPYTAPPFRITMVLIPLCIGCSQDHLPVISLVSIVYHRII